MIGRKLCIPLTALPRPHFGQNNIFRFFSSDIFGLEVQGSPRPNFLRGPNGYHRTIAIVRGNGFGPFAQEPTHIPIIFLLSEGSPHRDGSVEVLLSSNGPSVQELWTGPY